MTANSGRDGGWGRTPAPPSPGRAPGGVEVVLDCAGALESGFC